MNCRHAAALALIGWYLIVPPDSTVPHSVDAAAPISRWSRVATFESADDCKRTLMQLQGQSRDLTQIDKTGKLRRFKKRQAADPELARSRVDHATCVATGNPRLKKK